MNCPHCGKELNTTTFVNPMQHVQAHDPQPIYVNLNAAAAATAGISTLCSGSINLAAMGANPWPIITTIKL